MIIGIGNDLIDIRRIEKTLARHGERFTTRVFTEIERAKSDRRAAPAASFCASECSVKAITAASARIAAIRVFFDMIRNALATSCSIPDGRDGSMNCRSQRAVFRQQRRCGLQRYLDPAIAGQIRIFGIKRRGVAAA